MSATAASDCDLFTSIRQVVFHSNRSGAPCQHGPIMKAGFIAFCAHIFSQIEMQQHLGSTRKDRLFAVQFVRANASVATTSRANSASMVALAPGHSWRGASADESQLTLAIATSFRALLFEEHDANFIDRERQFSENTKSTPANSCLASVAGSCLSEWVQFLFAKSWRRKP